MAARRDEFADLYAQYQIQDMMAYNTARERQEQARIRLWQGVTVGLFGAAFVTAAATAIWAGENIVLAGLILAFAVAGLAVAAGIVMSDRPAREAARARLSTAAVLKSVAPPHPRASEQDLLAWVEQVEAILHLAPVTEAGPDQE